MGVLFVRFLLANAMGLVNSNTGDEAVGHKKTRKL